MIQALVGEESFLVKRALEKLLAERVPAGARDFNFETFDGADLDVRVLADHSRTLPLMAERRVILVRSVHELKKGTLESLEPLLKKFPNTTDLILTGDKVDRRLGFWRDFEKVGKLVEFKPMTSQDIPRWLAQEGQTAGFVIDREAATWLVTALGTNLSLLHSALEKLFLLKGKERNVTMKDVESCVTAFSWKSVFELTDTVGKKDIGRAMTLFNRMSASGESPIALLALIARHFRILLKVKEGDTAGVPPYFLRDYQQQAQGFSQTSLTEKMERLFQADRNLKSVPLSPVLQFERLLMELCRDN